MANHGTHYKELAALINEASTNLALRTALVADPRKILTERGIELPRDIRVRIEEEAPDEVVIVLPRKAIPGTTLSTVFNCTTQQKMCRGNCAGDNSW